MCCVLFLVALRCSMRDEKGEFKGKRPKTAVHEWRMTERMRTFNVALVTCLNIGVDPPDQIKPNPCARLECWIDPESMPPPKALEAIGNALQMQYERWQTKAKYKQCLDPTVNDVKRLCTSLRKTAKNERILFHYNGHGVPKPTANGELWVFNKTYTQYIPLSVYELQSWMGTPAIYVLDCSSAGIVVDAFTNHTNQKAAEYRVRASTACVYRCSLHVTPWHTTPPFDAKRLRLLLFIEFDAAQSSEG